MTVDPFIEAEETAGHSVKSACRLLKVSRAAYYERRKEVPSQRALTDAELLVQIRDIHKESKGTYGAPRIYKELLHRHSDAMQGIGVAVVLPLSAPPSSPLDAIVAVIVAEVQRMFDSLDETDRPFDFLMIRRFTELVQQTPALRAAQLEMTEKVVQVAAEAMAARAGVNPEDPEPQIAAHALCGLWSVMYLTTSRYSDGSHTGREVHDAVIAESVAPPG
jgi:hypothetical protein